MTTLVQPTVLSHGEKLSGEVVKIYKIDNFGKGPYLYYTDRERAIKHTQLLRAHGGHAIVITHLALKRDDGNYFLLQGESSIEVKER